MMPGWRSTRGRRGSDRLWHWLDIAECHWIVDQACARSATVKLVRWINEWQPVLDSDGNPAGFVLHTQFREQPKPLSCSPDAAFLLEAAGHKRVFSVEIDRNTTGARRVAASKMPGFCELALLQGHRRWFPETTFEDFSVLVVTTTPARRDLLRRSVTAHEAKRPDLWLFAAFSEFSAETALHSDIIHDCSGQVGPLVAPAVVPTAADTEGGSHAAGIMTVSVCVSSFRQIPLLGGPPYSAPRPRAGISRQSVPSVDQGRSRMPAGVAWIERQLPSYAASRQGRSDGPPPGPLVGPLPGPPVVRPRGRPKGHG